MIVLLNNSFIDRKDAKVDIEDRGYQFGDGIYEVVRVYEGEFYEYQPHIDRLYNSAAEIQLTIPHTKSELMGLLDELVKRNGVETGYVYFQYTRGEAPRGHAFPASSTAVLSAYVNEKPRPTALLDAGMHVITTADIRWLRCDIKSLNLLGAVLANQEAKAAGKDEAILHRDGVITECSLANCFIVKGKTVYTHPANNLILNGITRQVVVDIVKQTDGLTLSETTYTLDDLRNADEVFATGTTIEVMPIVSVDDVPVGDGKPGPITNKLQALFSNSLPGVGQSK